MSEGLKALKKLGEMTLESEYGDEPKIKGLTYYHIIKKALKEYEQYKAIEKEFGIDLVTLFKAFKALKNGFYDENKEYHHFSNLFIDDIEIFDSYEKVSFYLKDYGKTWALTKEELE